MFIFFRLLYIFESRLHRYQSHKLREIRPPHDLPIQQKKPGELAMNLFNSRIRFQLTHHISPIKTALVAYEDLIILSKPPKKTFAKAHRFISRQRPAENRSIELESDMDSMGNSIKTMPRGKPIIKGQRISMARQ